MSEYFMMLADVDATPSQAEGIVRAVLDRFRNLGLITGDADPDFVYGGPRYRPGHALAELYEYDKHRSPFWETYNCSLEFNANRYFNGWALNLSEKGFICPACGAAPFDPGDAWKSIGKAVEEWMDESGPSLVPCPECRKTYSITEWRHDPPLGFCNVSFTFWNWPPFDSPPWKIDIPWIVRDITGHTIVITYGRI